LCSAENERRKHHPSWRVSAVYGSLYLLLRGEENAPLHARGICLRAAAKARTALHRWRQEERLQNALYAQALSLRQNMTLQTRRAEHRPRCLRTLDAACGRLCLAVSAFLVVLVCSGYGGHFCGGLNAFAGVAAGCPAPLTRLDRPSIPIAGG